ncbi:replication factor C subunit 4 [Rhizophlyctis rosea]|uniref:Replication factor C subunit 2 n=1 Tax=Rhizophlyctis rosea TaxID=64517 RepID=A0AAD5S3I9_9FUNG|nr:replication factor C subunit 4 [Rhizophlyctis rosea]
MMATTFFSRPTGPTGAQKPAQPAPWVEKYRPKKMDDISSQEEAVAVLKRTMESANLPHLLFYGPPGSGKTSTILALARELYGPELIKTRVLELNASDERGIDIIRMKVKDFARVTVSQSVSGYPCPPYKIIILDEADSMTTDAQSALRRTMETYSKITRFCLVCNYVSRIIEPLASRCAKFRFKPLDDVSVRSRLQLICETEGVNCPAETIETLARLSEGDMRRSIMLLQSAHRLYRTDVITSDAICEIAGVVPTQMIETLMAAWQSKDFHRIEAAVGEAVRDGYSGAQLLSQLHDRFISDPHLTSAQKAKIAQSLGHADKCLTDGADEHLQLLNLMVAAF